jgi:hypothetical protein
MSSGGRLILTNSSLSNLPIYTMGFYQLPLGIHRRMDQSTARFLWRGSSNNFKYHMVSWLAVCRPKQFGGRGIINTEILNRCLITMWVWKLHQQPESLWVRLIRAKYMRDAEFFQIKRLT